MPESRSQRPGGALFMLEQLIPSPQLNSQMQATSERKGGKKEGLCSGGCAGEDGSRLSQVAPAWQGKPTSQRQADEDVSRKLRLFRESPGGQFCCRYDSAESLTCEVKVLVLEAPALPAGFWGNQEGCPLGKEKKRERERDLTQGVSFPVPSTFINCRKGRSTEFQFPGRVSAEKHSRKQSTLDRVSNSGSR